MNELKKGVEFDPGYSKISFSFLQEISRINSIYNQVKSRHQKKFLLMKNESEILSLIDKSASFYLGCMLWGGYLKNKFKAEPMQINGNHALALSEKEKQELDCAYEAKIILEYLDAFSKDCKYFFGRDPEIKPVIREILTNYVEFAQLNNNFIQTTMTNQIKVPNALEHFETLIEKQLDDLHDEIKSIIDSGKIENLLKLGFYKK